MCFSETQMYSYISYANSLASTRMFVSAAQRRRTILNTVKVDDPPRYLHTKMTKLELQESDG